MLRKPDWIRYKTPAGRGYLKVKKCVMELGLNTICTEAKCPNVGECFAQNTATFLILGRKCTRDCLYCAVEKGVPDAPDPCEPERVAEAVKQLDLKYAVITSVTRDDIHDGGASFFSETSRKIKLKKPKCGVELLVPDFRECMNAAVDEISAVKPDILNHNIEIVKRLFDRLRPSGDYQRSLELIRYASDAGLLVKSGLMIGFGEDINDIRKTMDDLVESGCSFLTVGQYLSPDRASYAVRKYYHPEEFEEIKKAGDEAGFKYTLCGPNIRSSYHASLIPRKGEIKQ